MSQIGQKSKDGLAVKQAFFTKKPDALYAITPGWPGRELELRNVKVPDNTVVTMLGVNGPLKTKREGTTLTIQTPELAPDSAPCRHAFTFKITGAEVLAER